MDFEELFLERKLHIDTMGRDETRSDIHHNPYQPTYYSVLEWIKDSGYVNDKSVILDYGCGKGRVLFYLSYYAGCKCFGIEREDVFYYEALKNRESFLKANRKRSCQIDILRMDAEKYVLDSSIDTVFFFNPFSVEITKAVLSRIKESYYMNPRKIRFLFYYLMENTEQFLSEDYALKLIESVDCKSLVKSKDVRHKLNIYELDIL